MIGREKYNQLMGYSQDKLIIMTKLNRIIDSYTDALSIRHQLVSYQMQGWKLLYRGHASSDFQLVSTIGRKKPINYNLQISERLCFESFKELIQQSIQDLLHYKLKSYNDDMFYMSIGRHLGLYCRLLDWTASLETALYFCASDEHYANDLGRLFVLMTKDISTTHASENPFEIEDFTIVKEDYLIPANLSIENFPLGIMRRSRQNGFFTISRIHTSEEPLYHLQRAETQIFSFDITPNAKKEILANVERNDEYLYINDKEEILENVKAINSRYFR